MNELFDVNQASSTLRGVCRDFDLPTRRVSFNHHIGGIPRILTPSACGRALS